MLKIIGGEFAVSRELLECKVNNPISKILTVSSGRSGLYTILKNMECLSEKPGGGTDPFLFMRFSDKNSVRCWLEISIL